MDDDLHGAKAETSDGTENLLFHIWAPVLAGSSRSIHGEAEYALIRVLSSINTLIEVFSSGRNSSWKEPLRSKTQLRCCKFRTYVDRRGEQEAKKRQISEEAISLVGIACVGFSLLENFSVLPARAVATPYDRLASQSENRIVRCQGK